MKKKEKAKKEPTAAPKRKPKYGMLSCVGYIYGLLWRTERSLAFAGILTVPLSLIVTAIALYTPSMILRSLEEANAFSTVALVIIGLIMARLLFDLCNNIINVRIGNSEQYVLMRMIYINLCSRCNRDWYLDYDPKVQKMNERADQATTNNHTAGVHFPMDFAGMLSSILKFILFGSVISMLHPVITLLIAVGCAVNYGMSEWKNKKNYSDYDIRNDIDKRIMYTSLGISRSVKYAKDIRLYSMRDSLHQRFRHLISLGMAEQKKLERRKLLTAVVSFLVVLIRDGASYAFLIYNAVNGNIDAASFVLYFSAITSMSDVIGSILHTVNRVNEGAMQVSDFREATELEGCLNHGKGVKLPTAPFSIEFKNVSYKYPNGEGKVLDNVSFKIEAGEKIALVGRNGAGKTTLTMMMCGLLLPNEGEVLIDGRTLFEYNRDDMYSLFGFVPQDYHLLPVSIARNIASAMTEDEIDRDRLTYCIEVAGLSEKISALPKGADTPLNREVNRDGIELSGGETQKLLLARLLYKNPLCIILDEPTAALDPIAEDRMYRRYNEIAEHATSIFISHRLASTRFCDRIFLLDNANFAEVGTHDELMARGGKYRELFDVQSKYYKEAEENESKQ